MMLSRVLQHAAAVLAEGGAATSRRASPASRASNPSVMRYASAAAAGEPAGASAGSGTRLSPWPLPRW